MRRSLVFGLRARGVDVLTAAEAGMINREDEEHLRAAAASGRAVFTFNTGDYCALHQLWASEGRTHAGIVVSLFKPDAFANFTDARSGKPGFRLIKSTAAVRQCAKG